jgi:hypothetical protein
LPGATNTSVPQGANLSTFRLKESVAAHEALETGKVPGNVVFKID